MMEKDVMKGDKIQRKKQILLDATTVKEVKFDVFEEKRDDIHLHLG